MTKKIKQRIFAAVLLGVILVVVSLLSMFFGSVYLSPKEVFNTVGCKVTEVCTSSIYADVIIWQIRFPRIILAALVGLLLALSGTILQGVLRNPLADPYILGVSGGGAVGAAIAMSLGLGTTLWGFSLVPLLAFLFSLIAVFVVYNLSRVGGRITPENLLLAGVAVSAFCGAIISMIVIIGGDLQSIYFWLLGSLSGADWKGVLLLLPYALIGIVVGYFYSKELNALLFGDEMAMTLGVDVDRIRMFLLAVAALLAAAAVSVAGLIGFVGLLVPHFIRFLVGPHHRFLVLFSALSGMLLLVVADTIARTVLAPVEIPVGVVMAFIGAPFFLYLLRRKHQL
ncbi:MAG: iron ABC transporter permease [Candidatus Saganbacteria bacterium]|nr:iron ABC transporter permease [Candidatus Saganbacteria bacterium]